MLEYISATNSTTMWIALSLFVGAVLFDLYVRTKNQRKEKQSKAHSERIHTAIQHMRENGLKKITKAEYKSITKAEEKTAKRDLEHLIELGIFKKRGRGGGTHYTFAKKSSKK